MHIFGSRVDQFNMFSEYNLCGDNIGGCVSLMDFKCFLFTLLLEFDA